MPEFADLGLSAPVLRSVREMGFEEPTPVQLSAIPPLIAGRDVVAQALTGTGKTAAYGIPLIQSLNPRQRHPQAIVLTPTRELAIQVAEHLGEIARHTDARFLPIYGGQPIDRQLRALSRGVQCVVATPGRLMDHMRRGTIDLGQVRMLVLDEADQMLAMGFQEDVEYVIGHLPEERLTALFSATMPKPILDIVHKYMRDPEMIHLSRPQALTVPEVEQVYYQVPFPRKFDALCRVLDARDSSRTMVFCSTKRMVDEVAERLPAHGYAASAMHGDVNQAGRERILKSFREGRVEVLVATDVAARGLDVPDVDLVVNFDIPPDPEYYVHRIGRTARSGRAGEAITFINPREFRELQMIERVTGARIRRGEVPTPADREERDLEVLTERLLDVLDRGAWRRYQPLVEELAPERGALEVAAAALALAAEGRQPRRPTRASTPPPEPAPAQGERPQPAHLRLEVGQRRPPRASGPPAEPAPAQWERPKQTPHRLDAGQRRPAPHTGKGPKKALSRRPPTRSNRPHRPR